MSEKIEPALTPEEWASFHRPDFEIDPERACPYVNGVRWGRPDGGPGRPIIPYRVRWSVRASGRCEVCGSTEAPFEIDHIMPYSRGGTHDRANLQLLCKPCNRAKGARTMEEWRA